MAANPAVRRAEELLRQQEEDRQAREAAAFRQQVDRELEEIRLISSFPSASGYNGQ